ncbi:MAG: hypothetical protein O2794_02550 [bacterium]|nr:hypothetical protein [bacterium]
MIRSIDCYLHISSFEEARIHQDWELIIPKWSLVSFRDQMLLGAFVRHWIKVDAIICRLDKVCLPPLLSSIYWSAGGEAWHYWVFDEKSNLFDIYLPSKTAP